MSTSRKGFSWRVVLLVVFGGLAIVVGGGTLYVAVFGGATIVECEADAQLLADGNYYELLNLQTLEVWGSVEFTPEQFGRLPTMLIWSKGAEREETYAATRFLRSPLCEEDREFTVGDAFGRPFQVLAWIADVDAAVDEAGLLTRNQVLKFQEIRFAAGQTLTVISDPDGRRYALLTRDPARQSQEAPLPAGWRRQSATLTAPLTFTLRDTVEVLVAGNGDSFQGPLPAEVDLSAILPPLQ